MDSGGANTGSSDSAKPSSTEPATLPGCGCASVTNITVRVTPTTGGQFDLQVAKTESVENLKKLISKKLKVPKERICLLHRDRQLRDGTLQENQLMDGSRLTLLPSVETGLLAQRPEQSVMQALESLNDSQVNDFLSGKAPLNLTMRLGDHMMLIQLQLSTVTPSSSRRSANSTSPQTSTTPSLLTTSRNTLASSLSSVIAGAAAASKQASANITTGSSYCTLKSAASPKTTPSVSNYPATPPTPPNTPNVSAPSSPSAVKVTSSSSSGFKFSPPTSPPAKPFTSFFSKPVVTLENSSTTTSVSSSSSPAHTSSVASSSESAQSSSSSPSRSVMVCKLPFKTLEDVKGLLGKKLVETVKKHSSSCATMTTSTAATTTTTSSSTSSSSSSFSSSSSSSPSLSTSSSSGSSAAAPCKCDPPSKPTLDTRALAEASRNLTQTLKQLSSEVLTSRADPAEDSARARRQGAIIESMHHHGKGVYSGTFSGTLNPALQDRFGRPKRDISTIIHILNDLLCATPQYRRHARQGHTITVEATSGAPKQNGTAPDKGPSSLDLLEESVSLSRENQATRGKIERLRLIMEERRARRRARREARAAPYTTQWSAKSESLPQSPAIGRDQGEPMETSEQPPEQQLCELNPPEPVVA